MASLYNVFSPSLLPTTGTLLNFLFWAFFLLKKKYYYVALHLYTTLHMKDSFFFFFWSTQKLIEWSKAFNFVHFKIRREMFSEIVLQFVSLQVGFVVI